MSPSIFSRPELIWFFIGLLLFLAELVLPGFVIFFFGAGAWITALVCLIAHPGVNLQILIFAVTSVILLIALRNMIQKRFFYRDEGRSQEVEDEFTGKEAVAVTDIEPDKQGKVEFKGTTWKAQSDVPVRKGQIVIIKEKTDFKLNVEPKNN
jgi:inner membrane protein